MYASYVLQQRKDASLGKHVKKSAEFW